MGRARLVRGENLTRLLGAPQRSATLQVIAELPVRTVAYLRSLPDNSQ